MFKHATIYKFDHQAGSDALSKALAARPFLPCGAAQTDSAGWVPPRGENEAMVEDVGRHSIAALLIEQKRVPAATIRKAVDAMASKVEQETGRKPGRKERNSLKEFAAQELLPHAFPKQVRVLIWFDWEMGRIVVDTSSTARSDLVITELVKAWDGLNVQMLMTDKKPTSVMTGWLLEPDAEPQGINLGRRCTLKSVDELKSVVSYRNIAVQTEEVRKQIRAGMMATSVDVDVDGRVAFTVSEGLRLSRIDFLDVVFQNASQDEDAFDANTAILTGEMTKVIDKLVNAMGGEYRHPE